MRGFSEFRMNSLKSRFLSLFAVVGLIVSMFPACADVDPAPTEAGSPAETTAEVPAEIRQHPGFSQAVAFAESKGIPPNELRNVFEIAEDGAMRLNEKGLAFLVEGNACGSSLAKASLAEGVLEGVEAPKVMGKKPGGGGGGCGTCPNTPVSVVCPHPSTQGYTGYWGVYQVSTCRDDADSDGCWTTQVSCTWQQYAFPFYNYAYTYGTSPELPVSCVYCKNSANITVPNSNNPPNIACISGTPGVVTGDPTITCGYAAP
jgi:hypothetical protein